VLTKVSHEPCSKKGREIFSFFVLIAGILSFDLCVASDNEKLKIELDKVNQKLIILESWLTSARTSESKLEKDLRQLSYSIDETNSAIDDLDRREDNLKDSILETSRSVEIQRRLADENKLKLVQLLKIMQKVQSPSLLQILLRSESLEDFSSLIEYQKYLIKHLISLRDKYTQALSDLKGKETLLTENRKILQDNAIILGEERRKLEILYDKREKSIDALREQQSSEITKRENLLADQERLVELIKRLDNVVSGPKDQGFENAKGALDQPIFQISGLPKNLPISFQNDLFSKGLFIHGAKDAEVRNIYDGTVVFADWLRGYGLMILVDHGGGYLSLYANTDQLLRQPFERVESGEIIAIAGNTDGRSITGIYFEIRKGGLPIDLTGWFRD
jgi:septal ring factor EnvC (AmiA/AmiB activator)